MTSSKNKTKNISIITPVYNESEGITKFYKELKNILLQYTYYNFEIIFVNDGSIDNTKDEILNFSNTENITICLLDLSRNHGKEVALAAGFEYVSEPYDAVIIMDSDLQHPPAIIPEFIDKYNLGYDDIYAIRKNRNTESFLKKRLTSIYYDILQKLSNVKVYRDAGDFRLISKKAFVFLKQIHDKERYSKGYYSLIGFKKIAIEYDVPKRPFGNSKWNFWSLFKLAITGITSFSNKPLRFSTYLGFLVSTAAFIYLIFTIIRTLIYGESVTGYPTLICSILFLGGVQLIAIGILGEYVGKIFNEVKNRPLYYVNEFLRKKD